MLLLVTGASGVGKTTVRRLLQPQLIPDVECVELSDLSPYPRAQRLQWRQQTTELAVQRTVRLQREGRHLLLCGDPVAAVEVVAAPSAHLLDGFAACILDATKQAQEARLLARGDDPALLVHHHAFAEWMRAQATDPLHMLEVVATNGWDQMRWDRIPALAAHWHLNVIDTADRTPKAVSGTVLAWIRSVLAGNEPALHITNLPPSPT